jgi:hypothetical protein
MKIFKRLHRIEELSDAEDKVEESELKRREELVTRIRKSRENNLKLFRIEVKGD